MQLRLLTKHLKSRSLRLLSEALSAKLGYKVWRSDKPIPNQEHLLYGDCKDKLYQYQWFNSNKVPGLPFTTSKETANSWLQEGCTVVARTLSRSSEGKGIILLQSGDALCHAQVYTKYLKKKREYRVHVFKDQIVSVLEKRKKKGVEGDSKIRNTANGYIFCRKDVTEPEGIRELALKASKVTDSHFKGVDIGYNEKLNQLFVIEVNSAPGMEGSTITEYVEAICK